MCWKGIESLFGRRCPGHILAEIHPGLSAGKIVTVTGLCVMAFGLGFSWLGCDALGLVSLSHDERH